MNCHELRDLAPELALGIADGEERAEALRHLADCGECRRLVEQMTGVADELLMLAPAQEPPAGFESRVLEGLGLGGAPKRRRWRGLALRVAAPVAAAAVTAGVGGEEEGAALLARQLADGAPEPLALVGRLRFV